MGARSGLGGSLAGWGAGRAHKATARGFWRSGARQQAYNFVTVNPPSGGAAPRHYLSYTPHKTALSSGRRVFWPIHDTIWQQFDDYGGLSCLDVTDETFDEMNRDLRSLGFHGHKAAYELR